MSNSLSRVREFHESFECPIAAAPMIPDGPGTNLLLSCAAKLHMIRNILREYSKLDVRCLRGSLDVEETGESLTALANRDLKGLLDAYGDKDYVDMGSVLTFGFENVFEEACRRIHVSNMSKLGPDGLPVKDAAGKVVKGPNYKPVDLTDLVDGSWLAANPPKPKTRFEKLVESMPELTVTVLASSKYPDVLQESDIPYTPEELVEIEEAQRKASEWLKEVGTDK